MIFIKTGIVPAALKIGFFLVILFLCEQVYAADVTPPQLQSWDFTPKTVDVSSQAQVITVTFRVTDDLSGVVIPNVSASSDTTSQTTGFAQVSLISGNSLDGVWQAKITIPAQSAPGQWNINLFPLRDQSGNSTGFGPGGGFPTVFTVTANPSKPIYMPWLPLLLE